MSSAFDDDREIDYETDSIESVSSDELYVDEIESDSDSPTLIDLTSDKEDQIIIGIDPGSVNCGLCQYNVTKEVPRSMHRICFRKSYHTDEKGKKPKSAFDTGNVKLIDSVVNYISKNKAVFEGKMVFIEDQKGDSKEILAVQHAFQAILGAERCIPVKPSSIKCAYSDYFPKKPGIEKLSYEKRMQVQYAYDKTNARKNGRSLVPYSVRSKFERANPTKKDDGYDAFWVGKYASEFLIQKRKKQKKLINKRPRMTKKVLKG